MRAKHSIIIPAYNEAGRIAETLESVADFLRTDRAEGTDWEVIVVCDGCTDATAQVAGTFADSLPLQVTGYSNNRGKGYAVRQGVAVSTGDIVTFMDADGSTPVRELGRLSVPIRNRQADIVIGSRRAEGATVTAGQSIFRQFLGRAFAHHSRIVLGLDVRDTQCGFKVFRGTMARALFAGLRCDGFAFDLELLAEARERRLRVLERGVEWRETPGSTVRPLRDGIRMLRAAWQIRASLQARRRTCRSGPFEAPAPLPEPLYKGCPS